MSKINITLEEKIKLDKHCYNEERNDMIIRRYENLNFDGQQAVKLLEENTFETCFKSPRFFDKSNSVKLSKYLKSIMNKEKNPREIK
ncbi:MAG: hypothetical protein HRT87_10760, partial [Legionellales bacterium]|nr:hypothetical protein [Legionellales bacterium]